MLEIDTRPNKLGFEFSSSTSKVTGHSWRSIGYVGDQTTEKSSFEDGLFFERKGYMLAALDLGVNEKLYGLWEPFGPFVKNGQNVEVWNEDGGHPLSSRTKMFLSISARTAMESSSITL